MENRNRETQGLEVTSMAAWELINTEKADKTRQRPQKSHAGRPKHIGTKTVRCFIFIYLFIYLFI